MAARKAEFRIVGRDLTAAVLVGPGPALDAAIDQLTWFDGQNSQSRISMADLRRLASEVMKASPAAMRHKILRLLAEKPSPTARCLCAFSLPLVQEPEALMALADDLSHDRSSQVQSYLVQALLELDQEQQEHLSRTWFESPHSSQRAIAGRLSVVNPISQALERLNSLASDEEAQVRESAVEALIDLAGNYPADVYQTLQTWSNNPDKHKLWVVTRVISRAPLNRDIASVIQLLESIASLIPEDRDVRRWVISVLRALARQHRNLPVQEALSHWLNGEDPTLAAVATEALRRIA